MYAIPAAASWFFVMTNKPETVQKRLSVYHAQTQPLIDYYKKANVLVEVDGTQDINVVFQDIVKILGA